MGLLKGMVRKWFEHDSAHRWDCKRAARRGACPVGAGAARAASPGWAVARVARAAAWAARVAWVVVAGARAAAMAVAAAGAAAAAARGKAAAARPVEVVPPAAGVARAAPAARRVREAVAGASGAGGRLGAAPRAVAEGPVGAWAGVARAVARAAAARAVDREAGSARAARASAGARARWAAAERAPVAEAAVVEGAAAGSWAAARQWVSLAAAGLDTVAAPVGAARARLGSWGVDWAAAARVAAARGVVVAAAARVAAAWVEAARATWRRRTGRGTSGPSRGLRHRFPESRRGRKSVRTLRRWWIRLLAVSSPSRWWSQASRPPLRSSSPQTLRSTRLSAHPSRCPGRGSTRAGPASRGRPGRST